MLRDMTAVQLADQLDNVDSSPHATAYLSALDEATQAFRRMSPALAEAQMTFGHVRYDHKRSFSPAIGAYSDTSWEKVVDAAHALAAQLRPLGGTSILRCKRLAAHGVCNIPLDDDGVCRSTLGHTDDLACGEPK